MDSMSSIQMVSPSPGRYFTASFLDPNNATSHIRPQVGILSVFFGRIMPDRVHVAVIWEG